MTISSEDINFSAYEYAISTQPFIKKTCQPLSHLGIDIFIYFKLFSDGSYYCINNENMNYHETYLRTIKNQGQFLTNKFNCTSSQPTYFMISGDINCFNIKKDPIFYLLYDYDIWNIFVIHKRRTSEVMECYAFATTRAKIVPIEFYLSKLHLLEHFINYFHEKAKDIVDTSDKRKLAYLQQTFNFHSKTEEEKVTEAVKKFL